MKNIASSFIGLVTFILILIELIIGFGTLAIINIPRGIIPFKAFKIFKLSSSLPYSIFSCASVIFTISVFSFKLFFASFRYLSLLFIICY